MFQTQWQKGLIGILARVKCVYVVLQASIAKCMLAQVPNHCFAISLAQGTLQ